VRRWRSYETYLWVQIVPTFLKRGEAQHDSHVVIFRTNEIKVQHFRFLKEGYVRSSCRAAFLSGDRFVVGCSVPTPSVRWAVAVRHGKVRTCVDC